MSIRMTELDVLTDSMKQQECYKKYQKTLKEIQKDTELYTKLNEYRRKNVELHNQKHTLEDEAILEKKYHELITEELIHEFLYWEQETLKMIRLIYERIDEALNLDYSFL